MTPARVLVDLEILDVPAAATPYGKRSARGLHPPEPDSERGVRQSVNRKALPTLARMAREGRVVLCTYAAGATAGYTATEDYGSLNGALFLPVEPAIDRDALDSDVFADAAQPGALQQFCLRLMTGQHTLGNLRPDFLASLPATTQRGLGAIEQYCDLATGAEGERLVEIFHLWSGELAGCDYLLTMDAELARFLHRREERPSALKLQCRPIEPEALLLGLDVVGRDEPTRPRTSVTSLVGRLPSRTRPLAR